MNIAIISFQDNADIIGAKYIHAFLMSHNHKSHLILQSDPDCGSDTAVLKFIADNNIEVAGISLMSCEFYRASQFAKEFKRRFKDIPLIFGGIHATVAPEECLSVGDIVVRGEGEHTLLELLGCIEERRDFSGIPGICLIENSQLKLNPPRSLEPDIDKFPFPKHLPKDMYVVHKNRVLEVDGELFRSISRYKGTFPNIITTRGCPFSCTYCCNSALKEFYGHYPVRKRSVESVIAEISEIITEHKDCLCLNIQDDCFLTYDNNWVSEFTRQYKDKINVPFIVRTTPRHINLEKLTLLKEAGLMMLSMGLQSGSDRVNREVFKRPVTGDAFLNATRLIHSLDIFAYYDVILDNPYETEEDTLNTLRVILQIPRPFQLQLFSLSFFQGTELHKRAQKDGLSFKDPKTDRHELTPNTLNKLIIMAPTVPQSMIEYFISRRNSAFTLLVIDMIILVNTLILNPVLFLRLIHRAYGSNLPKTFRLIKFFGKTALATKLRPKWE
ncbi:MAG: cobalamin B12-binding domain-containing protein [Nitrospirae bacterium]|nr:cobalamin B12-binding domain-containing protein [Nitrospirota bacterium]